MVKERVEADTVLERANVPEAVALRPLAPIQRVGLFLAAFVGSAIAIVIVFILVDYLRNTPTPPDMQRGLQGESAKAVLDNYKSAQELVLDRVTKVFDLIVVKALLPVFTAILGYIFGTRALGGAKTEWYGPVASDDCMSRLQIIFNESPLSPEDALLVDLCSAIWRPVDTLAYTPEFDRLFEQFNQQFPDKSKAYVFNRLLRLRKAARLPQTGWRESEPIEARSDDLALARSMAEKYAGGLGQRDRLPYTEEFDKLVAEFNSMRYGPPLHPHVIWRLILRVAR